MLQVDHIYEFLYQEIFNKVEFYHLKNGVPSTKENVDIFDITVFTPGYNSENKIFFYDQEPLLENLTNKYLDIFNFPNGYTAEQLINLSAKNQLPHSIGRAAPGELEFYLAHPELVFKKKILAVSEHSKLVNEYQQAYDLKILYYFFHGFAALDWYRGYYALNYSKPFVKNYQHDFVSYNRIINGDRSYRIYWISKLAELGLLPYGQVSFNVTDNLFDDWRDEVADPNTKISETAKQHAERHLTDIDKLVIDSPRLQGSASADIPRNTDAFWHVVTETVFYYDKLHLTEKIFKPIVSKQPFMLLAAPGNLEYLRSYGFRTFDGIIDESYDKITDNDQRIEAVGRQLAWYCSLSDSEKISVMRAVEPIVMHNFHHFYSNFRHVITTELLDNTKTLLKEIGYDDKNIAYETIYKILTN